jgi:hypothetical protein
MTQQPLKVRAERAGFRPYHLLTLVSFAGARAGYVASLRAAQEAALEATRAMIQKSSLRKVAKRIGCSPTYLSQVINGRACSAKFINGVVIVLDEVYNT